MRSSEDAEQRWKLTLADKSSLSELRAAIENGTGESPCTNGLRSLCWKAFLLFRNLDHSTWSKKLSDSRSAYSALRERFLHNIENPNDLDSLGDPLTVDDKSPWNTLRKDEILRDEIFQDVERCMPENFYFREPTTQTMLLDILFIFCKLNQDVGYRQGMHELLAPVLWVIERDAVDRLTSDGTHHCPDPESLVNDVLDSLYIEHDTFTIFSIVMQSAKSFYELGGQGFEETAGPSGKGTAPQNRSAIVIRSQRIHESLLTCVDPQLAEWLKEIEVLPQVFLIRWIRLLFGREFPFDDVLLLWDSLFAEDPSLEVVDLVCVAMLLRIRWQLLEADYSTALTLLLRYPQPSVPPSDFVKDALYLKKNLTLEGGDYLVFKHSRKRIIVQKAEIETSMPMKAAKSFNIRSMSPRPSQVSSGKARNSNRTSLPLPSPARFLQEQGGVEGIFKGAIGELKKNVQSLHTGSPSRQSTMVHRDPLQDVNSVSADTTENASGTVNLEARNKTLAKMLEDSLKELWDHQRLVAEDASNVDIDALSLAIAKVQFVQVYLEDSAMPIPLPEDPLQPSTSPDNTGAMVQSNNLSITNAANDSPAAQKVPNVQENSNLTTSNLVSGDGKRSSIKPASELQMSSAIASKPSPFHQPRPSLAQSSFSWMLGEDQRRSSFVAATPFPPETKRGSQARGKASFLFGDDKHQHVDHAGVRKGESEDPSGFTLGTLKGTKDVR